MEKGGHKNTLTKIGKMPAEYMDFYKFERPHQTRKSAHRQKCSIIKSRILG